MEEKIKGIEVIAYKGMESDMTCRDFKYEVGKSYKTDKVKLYGCGFHACLNPRDVLGYYYPKNNSRYFKVKLFGEITKCPAYDTQVAATEIAILEEITDTFNEVIETTEWWKNDNVLDLLYFSDGFARVQRSYNLCNYINKDGKYISDEWFNYVDIFRGGFARVQRTNGEWNFIDKQGNYLFNEWFNYLSDFDDGFARVKRTNGEWNFIDKDGNYLTNEWYKNVFDFHDGLAKVQRTNGEYNFINKQGKYLSKEWFKWVGDSDEYDLAIVEITNGELCKIDKYGNLIKNLQ